MGETFYEAKRRHRRVGWKFSVVAGIGVMVTGVPVALLVSPPFAALIIIVVDLLSLALPMPDLVGKIEDLQPLTIAWPYRRKPLRERTRLWPLAYAAIFGLAIPVLVVLTVLLLAASLALVGITAALIAVILAGPVLLVHGLAY